MAHSLILGMTRQGKTTLAKRIAKKYYEKGRPIIVLDPMTLSDWGASFITDNPEKFNDVVFKNTGCVLIVDESGEMIGRYAGEMKRIATRSAQFGHDAIFISQRAVDVDRTVRDQCTNVFVFRSSLADGKVLADAYVADGFKNCHKLKKGQYLYKTENMYETGLGKVF